MLLLIFAVALPSLLLTWFGLVAIENEREVARRRLYETYRSVLVKAQERFDSMLADLLERSERVLDDLEALDRQEILNRVWRRRAECFERLGRKNEQQITIAALREETREATASLGFARFFPPQSDMVVQVDLAALLASPLVEKLGSQGGD